MAKNKRIEDGFNSELVEGAKFDGKYQIPMLNEQNVDIPKDIIPFDQRNKPVIKDCLGLHFYIHDKTFKQVIRSTKKYLEEFRKFKCVISPDCSLYRDMPLCLQIVNTYLNRAVAHFLQKNGICVIPNVRWGDERSYEFCFDGIPNDYVVSISTYGCIQGLENKFYFKQGLRELIDRKNPQIIIVHGSMPKRVFYEFKNRSKFIHFDPWIKKIRRGNYGQRS